MGCLLAAGPLVSHRIAVQGGGGEEVHILSSPQSRGTCPQGSAGAVGSLRNSEEASARDQRKERLSVGINPFIPNLSPLSSFRLTKLTENLPQANNTLLPSYIITFALN